VHLDISFSRLLLLLNTDRPNRAGAREVKPANFLTVGRKGSQAAAFYFWILDGFVSMT
jgi:hypothetical protein